MTKHLMAIFLSAAMLLPSMAFATTLRLYEQARNDPAKQSQLLNKAFETSIARTLAALRDTHFKDGKAKSVQRVERDRARANRVESTVRHLTDKQSGNLVNMIAQYAEAQPDTELEDVISSFLLTEADKLLDQAGDSAALAPNK